MLLDDDEWENREDEHEEDTLEVEDDELVEEEVSDEDDEEYDDDDDDDDSSGNTKEPADDRYSCAEKEESLIENKWKIMSALEEPMETVAYRAETALYRREVCEIYEVSIIIN